MKTKISALIDGELDVHEMREVCLAMRKDSDLRDMCNTYALIGDSLRGEPYLATDVSHAVLGRLANEPVILAPGATQNTLSATVMRQWLRPALAMAATVAGVAVVAWLGLPAHSTQEPPQVAEATSNQPLVLAVTGNPRNADMQEYLIAHQIQGGSVFLSGDTQRIRTVSLAGADSR